MSGTLIHARGGWSPALERVETCGLCGGRTYKRVFDVERYQYARCSSCGLLRLLTRPAPAHLGELYGKGYLAGVADAGAVEAELRNPTFGYRRQVLEAHTPDRELMEIGCGDGNFLAYLLRHGWRVDGTEYSAEAAELVRRKHGVTIHPGEFGSLQFPNGRFAVIGMYHVVEHLYDPIPSLREVARTLRPGGTLHMQMPNGEGLEARRTGPYYSALGTPQHTYLYGPATITRLLQAIGLTPVSLRTFDPWHSPVITANTLRSVAAALLRRRRAHLALPSHLAAGTAQAEHAGASRDSPSLLRGRSERLLAGAAQLLSRAEARFGAGNIIDVVARK